MSSNLASDAAIISAIVGKLKSVYTTLDLADLPYVVVEIAKEYSAAMATGAPGTAPNTTTLTTAIQSTLQQFIGSMTNLTAQQQALLLQVSDALVPSLVVVASKLESGVERFAQCVETECETGTCCVTLWTYIKKLFTCCKKKTPVAPVALPAVAVVAKASSA